MPWDQIILKATVYSKTCKQHPQLCRQDKINHGPASQTRPSSPVLSPSGDTANRASPSNICAHPAVSSCAALMEPTSPALSSHSSSFTCSATTLQFTLREDLISEFLLSWLESEDLDPICCILALISLLFKINFKLTNNSLSKLLKIKRK